MAGREGNKRSAWLNVDILTVFRVDNLCLNDFIYKGFPNICYINFIPDFKFGYSFKHMNSFIPGVSGNDAVSVVSANRQGGVGKISRALGHVFIVGAVVDRELNINGGDGYISENIAVHSVIG